MAIPQFTVLNTITTPSISSPSLSDMNKRLDEAMHQQINDRLNKTMRYLTKATTDLTLLLAADRLGIDPNLLLSWNKGKEDGFKKGEKINLNLTASQGRALKRSVDELKAENERRANAQQLYINEHESDLRRMAHMNGQRVGNLNTGIDLNKTYAGIINDTNNRENQNSALHQEWLTRQSINSKIGNFENHLIRNRTFQTPSQSNQTLQERENSIKSLKGITTKEELDKIKSYLENPTSEEALLFQRALNGELIAENPDDIQLFRRINELANKYKLELGNTNQILQQQFSGNIREAENTAGKYGIYGAGAIGAAIATGLNPAVAQFMLQTATGSAADHYTRKGLDYFYKTDEDKNNSYLYKTLPIVAASLTGGLTKAIPEYFALRSAVKVAPKYAEYLIKNGASLSAQNSNNLSQLLGHETLNAGLSSIPAVPISNGLQSLGVNQTASDLIGVGIGGLWGGANTNRAYHLSSGAGGLVGLKKVVANYLMNGLNSQQLNNLTNFQKARLGITRFGQGLINTAVPFKNFWHGGYTGAYESDLGATSSRTGDLVRRGPKGTTGPLDASYDISITPTNNYNYGDYMGGQDLTKLSPVQQLHYGLLLIYGKRVAGNKMMTMFGNLPEEEANRIVNNMTIDVDGAAVPLVENGIVNQNVLKSGLRYNADVKVPYIKSSGVGYLPYSGTKFVQNEQGQMTPVVRVLGKDFAKTGKFYTKIDTDITSKTPGYIDSSKLIFELKNGVYTPFNGNNPKIGTSYFIKDNNNQFIKINLDLIVNGKFRLNLYGLNQNGTYSPLLKYSSVRQSSGTPSYYTKEGIPYVGNGENPVVGSPYITLNNNGIPTVKGLATDIRGHVDIIGYYNGKPITISMDPYGAGSGGNSPLGRFLSLFLNLNMRRTPVSINFNSGITKYGNTQGTKLLMPFDVTPTHIVGSTLPFYDAYNAMQMFPMRPGQKSITRLINGEKRVFHLSDDNKLNLFKPIIDSFKNGGKLVKRK